MDIGMIATNPMTKMDSYASSGDGYHTWTEQEIAQFIARHPFNTQGVSGHDADAQRRAATV